MKLPKAARLRKRLYSFVIVSLLLVSAVLPAPLFAQTTPAPTISTGSKKDDTATPAISESDAGTDFRVEKMRVSGGAEIITIFARINGSKGPLGVEAKEIPLVSILRDTLGDNKIENDRLRYIWSLTYTKPSVAQKLAAFVPLLYTRTTNKRVAGTKPPPPIIDLHPSDKNMWNGLFMFLLTKIVLSEFRIGARASSLNYIQNASDYRRAAIMRALTVFSLYDAVEGEKLISDPELKEIQARLSLSDKFLGSRMQAENLPRAYDKEVARTHDIRGQNWELLRQYSEAQGLYFEPLEMPDGSASHAIVWVSQSDIAAKKGKKFETRFLSIDNPWGDKSLLNWKGYSEVRWFDKDDRQVEADTPGAEPKTLIPLALYGLEHPRIPIILVDFRDSINAKTREMTRRVLGDVTNNLLELSKFGNLPFFFGRFIYELVTGRRGMDINQPSRIRSYTQLKLLLSLDASLDPEFRNEIANRLESVSLNPLENDLDVEAKLARSQYERLIAFAARPDGLPALIERDRREEMVRLKHGGHARRLFALAHLASFGLYTHREKDTPDLRTELDIRRQLDFYEVLLRQIASNSARPEIDSDMEALKRSLMFISEHGAEAGGKTSEAIAKIFSVTGDEDTRSLCLTGLYRMNNSTAKRELLTLYKDQKLDERWRDRCAYYLKLALREGQRIYPADAGQIAGIAGN